jgi:predicted acyl esterase
MMYDGPLLNHHFRGNGSKLTGQESVTKLIMGLWDHMDRIWTYRNNIYHANNIQQAARYKTEELDRRFEKYGKSTQVNIQCIRYLHYESKRCWANLADQYIAEAELQIRTKMYTLAKFLGTRLGVG